MNNAFDYDRITKSAAMLIYKFGAECRVTTYTDVAAANPIDPPTRTKVEKTTRGVWLKFKEKDIDDVNILRSDQLVLLTGTLNIDPRGLIIRDGQAWKVIGSSQVKPGPTTVIHKVQVRQ